MNEFKVKGNEYQVHKLPAMTQYHVVRRIGPILTELLPAITDPKTLKKQKNIDQLNAEDQLTLALAFAKPILLGLGKLSDEDAEFVLFSLLEGASMKISGAWSMVAKNRILMNDTLEFSEMIQIAARVFAFNLSGFFGALQP